VIAERLGVQPSSPSFHLAQLVHADLITQRYLSRQLIYSVSGSGVSMTALGHQRPKPSGCTSDRFRAEIGWMQWPLQMVPRA
jgi:hypothetical protein